jgi:hypothetical protein
MGHLFSIGRKVACVAMLGILPLSLAAQDSGMAMLHNNGDVLLNGSAAPSSSALMMHDSIHTQQTGTAKIDASGSTVDVQQETLLQFEGNELVLEHGSLQLLTSKSLRVRVGCITVIPVNEEWTQYDVTDVDGKVTVVSHKNDVRIESHGSRAKKERQSDNEEEIVHAGEQKSRQEKCGADLSEPAHATKAILNTAEAKWVGLFVVGGVTCWALCRPKPISPWQPK